MTTKNDESIRERLIAKFSPHVKARGGIFTKKTRGRLLGILRQTGRGRTEHDFWYDVRNYVKTGLIDLELFIEMADKKHVNQVVTKETLTPVVRALLFHQILDEAEPDVRRAEIAQLLIHEGFRYLRGGAVTLSHKRAIEEALDLTNYLVERARARALVRFLEWRKAVS